MKKIATLSFAIIAMVMFSLNVSNAAIPIKHQQPTTQQSGTAAAEATEAVPVLEQKQMKTTVKKSMNKKGGAAMPAILYIILAIFALGWLAMGINDNFGDYDWLISLLLYILFYIPGLIYTLIMMGKYY